MVHLRLKGAARLCVVVLAVLAGGIEVGFTQATSPSDPAPPQIPASRSQVQTPGQLKCEQSLTASGGAGLVVDSTSGQRKNWQPAGGEVTFTIRSFGTFDRGARPLVCFRWRTDAHAEPWLPAELDRVTLSDDAKTMQITVTIPALPEAKDTRVRSVGLVPLVDVEILLPAGASGSQAILIPTMLGITSVPWALIGALVVGALTFLGLLVAGWRRLEKTSTPADVAKFKGVNPLLSVISTPAGYASLSQLQVLLWTLVVIVSAAYVMLLSGDLIQITTGTLVLLGISGAATIGSKIHSQSESAQATFKIAPDHPRPLWSDLITNITEDGQVEIDVTRVQMLAFTLITAIFVAIRVFTSYVIPEIPEGFQILMGISNSVYLGSKVAQKAPTQP